MARVLTSGFQLPQGSTTDARTALIRMAQGLDHSTLSLKVTLASGTGNNQLTVALEHVPNSQDGDSAFIHIPVDDPDLFETTVIDQDQAEATYLRVIQVPNSLGIARLHFTVTGTGSRVFIISAYQSP